jgi:hypothetical protein
MTELSPTNHHNYIRIDVECDCPICMAWRQKRVAYEASRQTVQQHNRSCYCWKCRRCRELQMEYIAIQNKRDIYCELSWHASMTKGGGSLMRWLEQELLTSTETVGWWAKSSPCFSLGHWVWMFQKHVTGLTASLGASGSTV